jgi:16S rRNA (adenine1518-N6/adenine1519-N6)-dimethyltransferase
MPRRARKIPLKKKYGQHFLREESYAHQMIDQVVLDKNSSVFEIGGGDGFLTRIILQEKLARLWVFEIDPDWVAYLKQNIADQRTTIIEANILDIDFAIFKPYKSWILLANLPYQITFPVLHCLQENRELLKEGVIMIQEEVAQKIIKTHGRGYGFSSLFFQYYFEWRVLSRVPPSAFYPPPKVVSRLLYFKPHRYLDPIPDEERFWKFVKVCFKQPRRMLKNNLIQGHINLSLIPERYLNLRAQQLSMKDFLELWELLRNKYPD